MSAGSDYDCAVSDSSYCSPPPSGASSGTRAAAPVSMLTRGLAHAAAGGVRYAPDGRARVRFAVRWAGRPHDAPPPLGAGEDRRSGPAGGTGLPPGARKAPGPYGGTPGYRCVSEALCFPVCYGDKLWSPCMRGRSDGKPLDEFAAPFACIIAVFKYMLRSTNTD